MRERFRLLARRAALDVAVIAIHWAAQHWEPTTPDGEPRSETATAVAEELRAIADELAQRAKKLREVG